MPRLRRTWYPYQSCAGEIQPLRYCRLGNNRNFGDSGADSKGGEDTMISFQDVTYSYQESGEPKSLDSIYLEVKDGECILWMRRDTRRSQNPACVMRQRLCGMAVFSQFDISHRESLLDYILLGWLSNCECADFLNTEKEALTFYSQSFFLSLQCLSSIKFCHTAL